MRNVEKVIERKVLGPGHDDAIKMPNLVDIQLGSFEKFLQRKWIASGEEPNRQGLEEVFQEIFPIESPNSDMVLEYAGFSLDEASIKFNEKECRNKGLSFVIPIKAKINLVFLHTGEIRQKEIYMGDIQLMTNRGTFIINGAERVVVSQIHRSPGVIFSNEKNEYTSRIIPYRGSWLEFEIDQKKELIYTKIDRKKRIVATTFLRALGYDSREKIIDLFYKTKEYKLVNVVDAKNDLVGKVFAVAVYRDDEEGEKQLYRAADKIHPHDVEELFYSKIKAVQIIDKDHVDSLHSDIILNCFEAEEVKGSNKEGDVDELSKEESI